MSQRRTIAFVVLCVGCIAAVVLYAVWTLHGRRSAGVATAPAASASQTALPPSSPPAAPQGQQPTTTATATSPAIPKPELSPSPGKTPAAPPTEAKPALLYFESNALGDNYGKVAWVPFNDLAQRQYAADLFCDRVHFSGGQGICLHADRGSITTYYAIGFNDRMQRTWSFKLNGLPSRARVSPSGKLAAVTVFLAGQSYASLDFATQTSILNAATGETVVPDLEDFSVTRNGAEFKAKDFNFWGVTFAQDENRFYATLWTKGNTYLVAGDLAKHTAQVIHDNVECPALSPDNRRIAYKQRSIGGLLQGRRISWRITLLDLKTGAETALAETRSVDDQVEWLDNDHILYALSENEKGASASTDVWVLPTKPDGVPEVLLKGGFSPAVVRKGVLLTQR